MSNNSVAGFIDLGTCLAVRVTSKAVLIRVLETSAEAWMPKSCVQFGYELATGETFQGFVARRIWLENVAWRLGERASTGAPSWVPRKLPRLRSLTHS